MNSISFLDSILTRSLSTSRAGSGATTPAHEGSPSSAASSSSRRRGSNEQAEGARQSGEGARLGRRASDYSLTREREREKRRVASTLGLTALDSAYGDGGDDSHRPRRRHSKHGSRRGSARASSGKSDNADEERETRQEAASSEEPEESRHPKRSSESASDNARLRRTGSTPAPLRQAAEARRWGSLWGFGSFLEDARGMNGHSNGVATSNMLKGARASRSSTDLSATASFPTHRRASTGDAEAFALSHVTQHALLSEREREDVVEFEGADPDDDLGTTFPHAPPSTPYPVKGVSVTPKREHSRRASLTPEAASSALGTGSRLSSLLFGALNPLTDDYFGPQPSKRKASISSGTTSNSRHRRGNGETGSGNTTASEASSKDSHKKETAPEKQVMSDSARVSMELPAVKSGQHATSVDVANLDASLARVKDAESASLASDDIPKDPPPPYSDAANTPSTSRVTLLDAPSDTESNAASLPRRRLSRRRRFTSALVRGARTTLELLQRLVLIIVLGPYRAYRFIKDAISGKHHQRIMLDEALVKESSSHAMNEPSSMQEARRFNTASQALRPSAARHQAGRRDGAADADDGSDSEEPVTEDQAAAKAERRAARERAVSEKQGTEKRTEQGPSTLRQALSSRLLPNPNPIDPLLAHDRNAEKRTLQEREQYEEQQRKLQLARKNKQSQAASRPAVINRGPTSMLIHHSPKVLVLDLDETLIHSTSRSPTWSALADKSKSRMAVTAGGSLLGLEGLGGVLGLRGQVGVRPHQVEVVLDGRSLIYHVYKRPHVETFLRKVSAWYHVIVFTASVQEYADPVIDWLDQGRGLISGRLFREACTYRNGSYLKNLAHVDADLSRVCLVDNSPASYAINQANGIPIEGWTHDPHDEALLDLLPILDSLRFASDVRHILGVRGFSA